jgi:probable rRNA maturation factor
MFDFDNLTEENLDISNLKKLGWKILREEGKKEGEQFNCILIKDDYIRDLNKKYRGRDFPTDVLAFSFSDGEDSKFRDKLFGEIYISVDTATKNAKRYGNSLQQEIELLFVHGMLHLLGYCDDNQKDRKLMRSKEEYYLGR